MFKHALLAALFLSLSFAPGALGQDLKPIKLPPPRMDGGKPLMQALKERQTQRSFSPRKLPDQVLSNLLWAAWGINRSESGKRTAPSAMNRQEIDVYVATSDGVYLYDAKAHALKPVLARDIRALTGVQPFVAKAPVTLIYVADLNRMGGGSAEDNLVYSAADTGFIAENVYLFCASEGLAAVVRGSIERDVLAKTMKLQESQRIVLAQTLGYPGE